MSSIEKNAAPLPQQFKIETPGAGAFNMLFLISVALLCLFPFGTNTLGFALLLWGVLGGLRAAWLLETLLKVQRGTVRSRLLPWIILNGMERRQRTNIAKRAYRIFNGPFLYWFICAALYTGGVLFGLVNGAGGTAHEAADPLIKAFFQARHYDAATAAQAVQMQEVLIALALCLLTGLAFFCAHSFAYTHHTSRKLWVGPLFLFGLMVVGYGAFYGLVPPVWPQGPEIFMVLAAMVPLWLFARICWFNREALEIYAPLGLLCLALMLVCEFCMDLPPSAGALWLSGWVAVSVLWVRALGEESQKYLFRQD